VTVFQLLSSNFFPIWSTPIAIEVDSSWGKFGTRKAAESGVDGVMDDAKLIRDWEGKIWINFRNTLAFGYLESQINPLHFSFTAGGTLEAYIRTSETITIQGGKNFGFIPTEERRVVIDYDPVEVMEGWGGVKGMGRQGVSAGKGVGISGTSANLLSVLNGTSGVEEFFGLAHFRRPPSRGKNKFAVVGHHYSHVFFTIVREGLEWKISRYSDEFLFPKLNGEGQDGEIIQYAGGLDWGDEEHDSIVIGYGVNDCEGAFVKLEWDRVWERMRWRGPGMKKILPPG